jgi:hypothetical protein
MMSTSKVSAYNVNPPPIKKPVKSAQPVVPNNDPLPALKKAPSNPPPKPMGKIGTIINIKA